MPGTLRESDRPRKEEILEGWKIITSGTTRGGDKYWRPADRVWLPVTGDDAAYGAYIRNSDMPVIIRRGK
jgi:hypothetical protein